MLNGKDVRDRTLEEGMNLTQGIQDASILGVTVNCSKRAASGPFKATKDLGHGDVVCGIACGFSVGFEVAASGLIWCPIPGKVTTVAKYVLRLF